MDEEGRGFTRPANLARPRSPAMARLLLCGSILLLLGLLRPVFPAAEPLPAARGSAPLERTLCVRVDRPPSAELRWRGFDRPGVHPWDVTRSATAVRSENVSGVTDVEDTDWVERNHLTDPQLEPRRYFGVTAAVLGGAGAVLLLVSAAIEWWERR